MGIRVAARLLILIVGICWHLPAFSNNAIYVIVDKSDRELFVMDGDAVLMKASVVIGRNPAGHKQREGDMRTPEGTYRLTKRACRTCVFKRAFALNYPNRQDRHEGRTGSAILIHGGAGPMYLWTAGCIALTNADFDRLWALVPTGVELVVRA